MSQKITMPALVARLAVATGDTKKESEDFLKELFSVISDTLQSGESVKVRGLGIFKTVSVEPRRSVNVSTGEDYTIAGHRKVMFIPGKELASAVNEPFEMFQTVELTEEMALEMEREAEEGDETVSGREDQVRDEENDVRNPEEPQPENPEADELSNAEEPEVEGLSDSEEESLYELPETDAEPDGEVPVPTEERTSYSGNSLEESDEMPSVSEMDGGGHVGSVAADDERVEHDPEGQGTRFWTGFLVGAASLMLLVVAGWFAYSYFGEGRFPGTLSGGDAIAEAVPSDTIAASGIRNEALKPETADMNAADSVATAATEADKTETAETLDTAVPTTPSDRKVYDTISRTRYLTTMAKDHYGNYNLWPYIYKENERFLGHPDRIRPGTQVVIPDLKKYGVDPQRKADIDKAKKLGVEIYARYR